MTARAEMVEQVAVGRWRSRPVPVRTVRELIMLRAAYARSGVVGGVPFTQVPVGAGAVARVWGDGS